MFGFGKKKRPAMPFGIHCFAVKTRIARSVGKDGSHRCGAVRALPSVNKDEVVLQATDGHHATCLLTSGQMTSPRLVPPSVLPTRQLQKPIGIRLMDGQWESLEGRIVPDTQDAGGERQYPKLGDVLPVVGKAPFYETAVQAERRKATDPAATMHVMLGIDLDLLRKAAESLGTMRLTLFVPVPVKDATRKPGETCVNKPVAICPASGDTEGQGVAVERASSVRVFSSAVRPDRHAGGADASHPRHDCRHVARDRQGDVRPVPDEPGGFHSQGCRHHQ